MLGQSSLDIVTNRALDSARERMQGTSTGSRRRRRGKTSDETQFNTAATVDLGPLPHKAGEKKEKMWTQPTSEDGTEEKNPLEGFSFPSPKAILRIHSENKPESGTGENTTADQKAQSSEEIVITESERNKESKEKENENENEKGIQARRTRPAESHTGEQEGEPESRSTREEFEQRVLVPFGLEPPEKYRDRARSDNTLANSNNPIVLKWLKQKNRLLRRQMLLEVFILLLFTLEDGSFSLGKLIVSIEFLEILI